MTFLTDRNGIISEGNSTEIPLLSLATFTGQGTDVSNYGNVSVIMKSDVNSDETGLILQFSTNNIDWDFEQAFNYFAPAASVFNTNVKAQYFRVVYTNGNGNQTLFRLQTIFTQGKTTGGDGDVFIDFSAKYVDAFNRLRVSNPFSQVEFKTTIDKNIEHISEVSLGGATGIYLDDESSVSMEVSTLGDKIIRQTRIHGYYEPGKSLAVIITGILNSGNNSNFPGDVISRIGFFDDQDGFFYEYDGDTLYIVKRHNGNDESISQTNWNFDKFDGSGPSGFVIDVTKVQIFALDLQWLGVGAVRMGIFHQGVPIGAHLFFHENLTDRTFIKSANLPIRYEIVSNDTGANGKMKSICGAIISEGGQDSFQFPGSVSNETNIVTTNTLAPILSLRKKINSPPHSRSHIKINQVIMSSLDKVPTNYKLFKCRDLEDPLTGSNWQDVDGNHNLEYDSSATSFDINNCDLVHSCFVNDVTSIELNRIKTNFDLTSSIDTVGATGCSDVYIVAVQPITGATGSYFAAINFNINK